MAKYFQVAQGVWGMKLFFVNVYMIANRKSFSNGWVLVDTGPKGSAKRIINMAEAVFGKGTQPKAIILTHGHSDHSGSVKELLKHWDVPVMRGRELKEELDNLSANFKKIAVPSSGRYINQSAVADENGTHYVPPFAVSTQFKVGAALVGAIAGFMFVRKMVNK